MFVSVKNLHQNMGVDETIARFFVDRKVPAGNSFWRSRLVYVPKGNGYISIPVYYDLLFRTGLSRELLLEETHVQFMEQVMHHAITVEFLEATHAEQLDRIKALLDGRIKNPDFYAELVPYLEQKPIRPLGQLGNPIPSLNRADVFLFILCDLPMTAEQTAAAIRLWYALHTSYLLMDDVYDYKIDKQDNDENAILELGEGQDGFDKARVLLQENISTLHNVNPVLSAYFEDSIQSLDFTP